MASSNINNIDVLKDAFTNQLSRTEDQKTITLSGDFLYEAGVLVQYLNLNTLKLSSISVCDKVNDHLEVKGSASFLGMENQAVTLTGKVIDGEVVLALSANPTEIWNFKKCFSNRLPNYTSTDESGVYIVTKESFFYELVVNNPRFTITTKKYSELSSGINLSFILPIYKDDYVLPPFDELTADIINQKNLEVSGTIVLSPKNSTQGQNFLKTYFHQK